MKIGEIIKNSVECTFSFYRQGYLYYRIMVETEDGVKPFAFPVEVSDLGGATLNLSEKPITMMRYIRKALEGESFVPTK